MAEAFLIKKIEAGFLLILQIYFHLFWNGLEITVAFMHLEIREESCWGF